MLTIAISAAFFLTFSLLVETLSWWIKSVAEFDYFGKAIARTNIFLFGGRFFSLSFAVVISLHIEHGGNPTEILILLFFSFLVASLSHFLILHWPLDPKLISTKIAALLGISTSKSLSELKKPISEINIRSLFWFSVLSSFVLGLGTGVPLMLAATYTEFRLSISYVSQIINSGGTLVLLFFVDQMLYQSMEAGKLSETVRHYSLGRSVGFLLVAMLFATAYLINLVG